MKKGALFFSEYFEITSNPNDDSDFFDGTINFDLPFFIDPFLLFCSSDPEYKKMHDELIIRYLLHIARKTLWSIWKAEKNEYFHFKEVNEVHLWYSLEGNSWKWLWDKFAEILIANIRKIILSNGNNHLEKLCIITEWVGRDRISDFSANLLKIFLVEYTANIAKKIPDRNKVKRVRIQKLYFDYDADLWCHGEYELPIYNWKHIILVPKNILTTADTYLNKKDFFDKVIDYDLYNNISNDEVRFKFNSVLTKEMSKDDKIKAIKALILESPELVEEYIKYKEKNLDSFIKESEIALLNVTKAVSVEKVRKIEQVFNTYSQSPTYSSLQEANSLIEFFKQKVENEWVWREFWLPNGTRIKEKSIQNLFKLTWRGTQFYVGSEVDRWSWPVDFIVTKWNFDTTVIEFKLASNKKFLATQQVKQYKDSNQANNAIVVIFCFDSDEIAKTTKKITENQLENTHKIIDVSRKISASKQ